jgi:hypothetical protein
MGGMNGRLRRRARQQRDGGNDDDDDDDEEEKKRKRERYACEQEVREGKEGQTPRNPREMGLGLKWD